MGGLKRKSSNDESVNSARKKPKETAFSASDFQVMLKSNPFAGLETFINYAKGYPGDSDFDIVDDLCRTSSDFTDVLKLLTAEQFKTNETFMVVEFLRLILTRVGNDLKKYRLAMNRVVRQLLTSAVESKINRLLNTKNKSSHIKSVLKLMMAVIMQGPWAAREVTTWVEVNVAILVPLLNRKDMKDEEDVRACLLELIVSLLACDDGIVVKRLLEIKGFLNKIVADLHGDQSSMVILFLTALHKKVVCNPSITKTSKIHLFHEQTLTDISKLYRWSGPKHWKDMKKKIREVKKMTEDRTTEDLVQLDLSVLTPDQEAVRESTHALLMELCCSIKNGIVFYDKTFTTSGQNMNHILTNFLNVLHKPSEDPLMFELVAGILKSSPDQLRFYLPSLQYSCAPRCTKGWLQSAKFVRQIYEKQPTTSPAVKLFSSISAEELVSMAISTILPPPELWSCFKEATATSWLPVVHESLLLTSVIVRRLTATVKHVRKLSADNTNGCCNVDRFVALIMETFVEELPSADTLLGCWHAVVESVASGSSDKGVTNKKAAVDTDKDSSEILRDVPLFNQLTVVLQLLCGYYNLFPRNCRQHTLDFTCLLDGLEKARIQCNDESSMARYSLLSLCILQLLSVSDIAIEDIIKRNSSDESDILSSLLYILLSCNAYLGDHLRSKVKLLLTKLIVKNSLFEENVEEIEIWLSRLMSVGPERWHGCINLFVSSVHELMKDPLRSKAKSCNGQQPSFSGLVQVALKQMSGQEEFVDEVLVDILHLQHDPLVLCQAMRKAVAKLPRTGQLISRYLSKEISQKDSHLAKSDCLASKLENYFVMGHCLSSVDDVSRSAVRFIDALPLDDCLKATRQILSYLAITIQHFIKGNDQKEEVTLYLDLLIAVAKHCGKLAKQQASSSDQAEKTLTTDDFIILDVPERDPSQVFYQLSSAVFHSLTVEKYFLWKPESDSENRKQQCTEYKVSELITKKMSMLAEEIANHFPQCPFQVFENQISRVEEQIRNFPSGSCGEEVFDAMNGFVNLVPLSVIWNFAEALLLKTNLELTNESNRLNLHGTVLLKAFVRLVCSESVAGFSTSFFAAAFTLAGIGCGEFCELLVELVRKVPESSQHIQQDTLFKLLETGNRRALSVVAALVSVDDECRNCVSLWCSGNKKWKNLKEEYQEVMYETLEKYSPDEEICCRISKVFWNYLLDAVCKEEFAVSPYRDVVVKFLRKLIKFASSVSVIECWSRLTSVVSSQLRLTPSHVNLYIMLTEDLLVRNTPDCQERCCRFIVACIEALTALINGKTDSAGVCPAFIAALLKFFMAHTMEALLLEESLKDVWEGFVKAGLKHQNTDHNFLRLLDELISQLYPLRDDETSDLVAKNGLSIEHMFEMIISHSHFMPSIMKEMPDEVKDAVFSLLHSLVRRSSRCCRTPHIAFLLGGYQATLSSTDQRILLLLQLYETAGCSMTGFKPYFWGPKSLEHHASNKTFGMSLLPENTMERVIDLLDKSRVYESLLNFPLRRRLDLGCRVRDVSFLKSNSDCYDPAFLLPLFSHLLEPDCAFNCVKFIESHCLGYVLASLSCYDAHLRSLAYHILSAFCRHLKQARFPERLQVSYILECLSNSVEEPDQKLASIITIFLAKAVHLMLTPKDHMYSLINEFLLLKPAMDVSNVPEFYKLFFTAEIEYKIERLWILNLLLDGLRDTHDYHIMEKRLTFKIILGFYTFSVSDHQAKMLVLRILSKACGIKTVATDLVENHGLLSWIANISAEVIHEKRSVQITTGVINGVVNILHALWSTISGRREDDCIQPIVTAEMLTTLKKVYRCFRNALGETAKETCLKTLLSVTEYAHRSSKLHPEWKEMFD